MDTIPKQQPRPNPDFYYDTVALVTLLGLLFTGLVLWPLLGFGPSAPGGLHRHQWINLHLSFALAFAVICLIHIVRHWRWVKLMTPRHLNLNQGLHGIARFLTVALLTCAVVWGGYAVLEKLRLNPDGARPGLITGNAIAKSGDSQESLENGGGKSGRQGKGPRWRGGRGGF